MMNGWRAKPAPGKGIGLEPFQLAAGVAADPVRHVIIRGGSELPVEPRVMEVLVYLASRPGLIVSKRELMERVWNAHVVDEAVHRAISLLRSALGDSPQRSAIIETVPRHGYRLRVRPVPLAERGRRINKRLLAAVAAAAVIVIAAPLIGRSGRADAPAPSPPPGLASGVSLPAPPAERAIAGVTPSDAGQAPPAQPRSAQVVNRVTPAPERPSMKASSAELQPAPNWAPSAPRAAPMESPTPMVETAPAPKPVRQSD